MWLQMGTGRAYMLLLSAVQHLDLWRSPITVPFPIDEPKFKLGGSSELVAYLATYDVFVFFFAQWTEVSNSYGFHISSQ